MGITNSESNALGNGLKEDRDGGLTKFGRKAVERLNKVGLLIDCSHCGDQTTLDTVRWSDVVDRAGAPEGLPEAEIDPDDDATNFYTYGTTGFPKGAQLTHRGSITNMMNLAYMGAQSSAMLAAIDPEAAAARASRLAARNPDEPLLVLDAGDFPLWHAGFWVVTPTPWPDAEQVDAHRRDWGRLPRAYVRQAWSAPDPCQIDKNGG